MSIEQALTTRLAVHSYIQENWRLYRRYSGTPEHVVFRNASFFDDTCAEYKDVLYGLRLAASHVDSLPLGDEQFKKELKIWYDIAISEIAEKCQEETDHDTTR